MKIGVEQRISDDAALLRGFGASRHLLLNFFASELCLRGDSEVVQPHVKDQNILCWNGEVIHLACS